MRFQTEYRLENLGILWLFLYTCFLGFLLFSALTQALSHYYADAAYRTGIETELAESLRYQPENPGTHEKHGLIRLRNADYPGAAAAFERAIVFRQKDYLLWLRLGYARQMAEDIDGAADAYRRSIELAPRYSQPQYYMGLMLLGAGRADEGFNHLSRAAEFDPSIYRDLLRLARKTFTGDAHAIEGAVNPMSRDARLNLARYLIKYHYMTDSVRSFLVSDELNEAEKNEFVKYLLHKKNVELAREIWLSRPSMRNWGDPGPLHDGEFETVEASDPSGLGWQVNQGLSATAVARDGEAFHSGSNSLKIRFAGNVELGRPVISQLAFVTPGRRYALRFFFRSTEMISAGLAEIVITEGMTNELVASSAEIKETDGEWRPQQIDFRSRESKVVLISVQRSSCSTAPCPIFGNIWLDDLRLVEIPNIE